MTSPAAGARPDDDRRTGSTTPADGPRVVRSRRRGGRGRTRQNTPSQAASGVPAAGDAASPGGATPDSAAPGGAAVDPAGGAAPSIDVSAVRERIAALGLHDAQRLRRRLDGALRTRAAADRTRALTTLVAAVDTAEARLAARRAAVPRSPIPRALPVTARRDDIAAAIRDHQVVIVAGETGSGKTTQIPKICLELGRGVTRDDRPHPAPAARRAHRRRPDRRGAGHRARRRRRATRSASPTRSARTPWSSS